MSRVPSKNISMSSNVLIALLLMGMLSGCSNTKAVQLKLNSANEELMSSISTSNTTNRGRAYDFLGDILVSFLTLFKSKGMPNKKYIHTDILKVGEDSIDIDRRIENPEILVFQGFHELSLFCYAEKESWGRVESFNYEVNIKHEFKSGNKYKITTKADFNLKKCIFSIENQELKVPDSYGEQ